VFVRLQNIRSLVKALALDAEGGPALASAGELR
jgi:hypothetical protein